MIPSVNNALLTIVDIFADACYHLNHLKDHVPSEERFGFRNKYRTYQQCLNNWDGCKHEKNVEHYHRALLQNRTKLDNLLQSRYSNLVKFYKPAYVSKLPLMATFKDIMLEGLFEIKTINLHYRDNMYKDTEEFKMTRNQE